MAGEIFVKHTYKYLDTFKGGKIIREDLLRFDHLDDYIKGVFNLGATKLEITYLKTKGIYEIEK
jgi:hypothetical protein